MRITAIAMCFSLLFSCAAYGAPIAEVDKSPSLRLDLREVIERALAASEELKIKEREINKAEEMYRSVRSAALPHVAAHSSRTYNIDYPAPMHLNEYEDEFGVSASQIVWSFGKVVHAISSARKLVEANRFNREASRQEVIFAAKLGYYSALLARNTLSIMKGSYANAVLNRKLLDQRSYGGRSPRYEIVRLDAEIASRMPRVNEAKAELDMAIETLRRLIGADPASKIELKGGFLKAYPNLDYDRLVAMVYENEPSLKALSKTVESAEAKVKSSVAGFFPTISAFSSLNYSRGSMMQTFFGRSGKFDRYVSAGINVSIPIWEGGQKEAELGQARADKEIALLNKEKVEKEILLELKKAYLEYQQYKNNLKSDNEAVRLAEESFKQMQEMFASGQATLADLNDAERLLTSQRLNKEMTLFNINVALAKIERLIAGEYNEGRF